MAIVLLIREAARETLAGARRALSITTIQNNYNDTVQKYNIYLLTISHIFAVLHYLHVLPVKVRSQQNGAHLTSTTRISVYFADDNTQTTAFAIA